MIIENSKDKQLWRNAERKLQEGPGLPSLRALYMIERAKYVRASHPQGVIGRPRKMTKNEI